MKSNKRIATSLAVVISLYGWVAPQPSHGQQGNKAANQEAREAKKKDRAAKREEKQEAREERQAKKAEREAKKEERQEGRGGKQANKEEREAKKEARAAKKEEREAKREARAAKKEEGGATAEERQAAGQKRREGARDSAQPAAAGQPGTNNLGVGEDPFEVKGRTKPGGKRAANRRQANADVTGEGDAASEATQGGTAGEQPTANARSRGAGRKGTANTPATEAGTAVPAATGQAPTGAAPASTSAPAASTGSGTTTPSSSGASVQGAASATTGIMDRIQSAAGAAGTAGGTGKTSEPPPTTTDTPGTNTRPPSHGGGTEGGNTGNDRPPSSGGGSDRPPSTGSGECPAVESPYLATELIAHCVSAGKESLLDALNSVRKAQAEDSVDSGRNLSRMLGYLEAANNKLSERLNEVWEKREGENSRHDSLVGGKVFFVNAGQHTLPTTRFIKSAKKDLEDSIVMIKRAHDNKQHVLADAIDLINQALRQADIYIQNYQPPVRRPSDGNNRRQPPTE